MSCVQLQGDELTVAVECPRLAEIENRRQKDIAEDVGRDWTHELDWLVREVKRLREALESIRAVSGPVCAEFEICTHPQCDASCGAHLLALEALKPVEELSQ